MKVGGQRHAPAAFPLGKTQYPLFRCLGGPQGRSGQVRKISPPTRIRSPDRPSRSESTPTELTRPDRRIWQANIKTTQTRNRMSRFRPDSNGTWQVSAKIFREHGDDKPSCFITGGGNIFVGGVLILEDVIGVGGSSVTVCRNHSSPVGYCAVRGQPAACSQGRISAHTFPIKPRHKRKSSSARRNGYPARASPFKAALQAALPKPGRKRAAADRLAHHVFSLARSLARWLRRVSHKATYTHMVSSYSDGGTVAETTRGTETSARVEDVRSVSLCVRLLHKSTVEGEPCKTGWHLLGRGEGSVWDWTRKEQQLRIRLDATVSTQSSVWFFLNKTHTLLYLQSNLHVTTNRPFCGTSGWADFHWHYEIRKTLRCTHGQYFLPRNSPQSEHRFSLRR